MAQVINTNSLSLTAQNNLNKSQSALGTAIERLSSGLRINSAKDDAAGQAISNRFNANIKGLQQAARNANDGISLAQTTEGALNEVNNNLQNIRRLTVQAQNGSNSNTDLRSIQSEISQRLSEINRISAQTDFNGVKVLSRDNNLTIQVGANDNETITISMRGIDATTLGLNTFSVANGINTANVGATAPATVRTNADVNITTTAQIGGAAPASYVRDTANGNIYGVAANGDLHLATINRDTGVVTAFAVGATPPAGLTTEAATTIKREVAPTGADAANVRAYTGDNANPYVIQEGTGANARYFRANIADNGAVTRGTELSSTARTTNPLAALDNALSQVDGLRSALGAVQNRFDSVINNLNSTVNNLTSSQSRIQDADYATEVSNMSRGNILQQAGTSVLAQANQSTQNVLTLLR